MSAGTFDTAPVCPLPLPPGDRILLAHGGGGALTHGLVGEVFRKAFANPALDALHDGAVLQAGSARIALSTDSYVVDPLFFPGGTIGDLAVNGTVNDLAMCGAAPLALAAAFIIEEGLSRPELERVVGSMEAAARAAGVTIVTGDTKVVGRGKGDRLFITTTGVGLVPPGVEIAPQRARPGDVIILSGPVGAHGIAVLSVREGLAFESDIVSDTAPLNRMVAAMLAASPRIHVLRDATRGGLATVLCEIAASAGVGISVREADIPVEPAVGSACEILGLDPLYVANEGRLAAFVPPEDAQAVLAAMRADPAGSRAAAIGEVVDRHGGTVELQSRIHGSRILDMMPGEQLPRIC